MAQRNIDFGTFPDDPSADAIRTAFEKVQQNFTELYTNIDAQAVLSVNRTPGPGVTVNSPTGNVVVSANISAVTISSGTLAVGVAPSNGSGVAGGTATISSTGQQLQVDLPSDISGNISNITLQERLTANVVNANVVNTAVALNGNIGNFSGNLSANSLTVNSNASAGNISTSGALSVTGNTSAGNISTSGALSVTGNANVGNLGAIGGTFTGNVSALNANISNTVTANFFVGDGSGLSNVAPIPGTEINNEDTSVDIPNPNGNVLITVNGVLKSEIAPTVFSILTNATINGNVSALNANLGNSVVANTFTGNLIGSANTVVNNAQPNITSVGTLTSLTVTGNASAGNITATTLGGTLTTASQPNITSVGTLTSLSVTGNVSANNLLLTSSNLIGNTLSFAGNTIIRSDTGRVDIVAEDAGSSLTWRFNTDGSLTTPLGGNISAGNLSATGVSATTLGGTLTTAAQPNVTSVGTLTGLNINGNLVAGNITSNTGVISGNGSGLSAIAGANVTGQVANALISGTVYTSAQPNITSVGSLTSLTVTGNASAGNVNAGNLVTANFVTGTLTTASQPNITSVGTLSSLNVAGNLSTGNINGGNLVSANFFQGDGGLLSNLFVSAGSFIANGSSNVVIAENSNITMSVAGTANVVTVTSTGANVNGYANVTGTLTANTVSANILTGTLGTSAQPNITSLGQLSGLTVNGLSNLGPNGNVRITGGVNNAFLKTDGNGNLVWDTATLVPAQGANTQVIFNDGQSNYAGSANLTFNQVSRTLTVSNAVVSGNVFANSGAVVASTLAGSLITASQPNVTSVGTLTGLNVSGAIVAPNITANTGVFTGNGSGLTSLPGGNVVGAVASATNATTAGTVTTAAQPNITSIGTLTSLVVSGNINAANISGGNTVSANFFAGTLTTAAQPNITSVGVLSGLGVNGNITAQNITANTGVFTGNGSGLTNLAGANVTGTVANATNATTANTASVAGTVSTNAQPNITSVGALTSLIVNGNVSVANVTATARITANVFQGNASNLSNIPGANVTGTVANATLAGTVSSSAQPNITSVGTLTTLAVTGNANVGNIGAAAGVFTSVSGNGSALTGLNANNLASGTVPSARLSGSYAISVTSATTAGTVTTAAQPNITSVGSLSALTVTGNVSAGNVSGNLITGTLATAAQPNITSVGTLTSLAVTGNVSANNVTANSYHIRSVQTGISAAGTNQSGATGLSKEVNVVSTVTGTAGVRLPAAIAGMVITITNTTANSLRVYPASGGAINTLSSNVAFIHGPGATLQFVAPTTTQWYTIGATYA